MEIGYDFLFKLLLVGDTGVGKSSLVLRFAEDAFAERPLASLGVDFKIRQVQVRGKTVKLQIWDTAGQERFRTITSAYYRGAHGVIIAYDITNRESFEHVQRWIQEVDTYNSTASKILVGCKADLAADRAVTSDEAGREFADSQGMMLFETSAKTNICVADVFMALSEQVLEKQLPELFPRVILTLASCSACSLESGDSYHLSFTKLSGETLDVVVERISSVRAVVQRISDAHGIKGVKLLAPSGSDLEAKDLEQAVQASLCLDASKVTTPSASKLMREKIKAAFANMDTDKSGTLTLEELHRVFSQISPAADHEEVQSLLTSMDTNKNGVVDLNEFVDWLYDGIVDTSREQMEGLLDAVLNVKVGDDVMLRDQGVQAVVLSRTTTDLEVRMPDGAKQSVAIEDLSRV